MSEELPCDFAVIGGGSAGYAAARTAAALGLKTCVVDGAEELGGLCILRGCMPSKTLLESSTRYTTMRRAEEFGLRASGLEVRGPEILARKRRLSGGATAVEFATYYAGLGREVTLIQRSSQLLKGTDPDLAAALAHGLRNRGVKVLTETKLVAAERAGERRRITFEHDGKRMSVE